MPILEIIDVHKRYGDVNHGYDALRGIDLTVASGEFLAIRGPSGCGKSTLLHILGAMDRPTQGCVLLQGKRLDTMSDTQLAAVRRRDVGFVFQTFNLLPTLNVMENVALPLALDGHPDHQTRRRALEVLEELGLRGKAQSYPSELSGGEAQRVAIARAVAMQPILIMADEPTGSLDSENGRRVLELLSHMHHTRGLTIVMATHDDQAASFASRTVHLRDGRLESSLEPTSISGAHGLSAPV